MSVPHPHPQALSFRQQPKSRRGSQAGHGKLLCKMNVLDSTRILELLVARMPLGISPKLANASEPKGHDLSRRYRHDFPEASPHKLLQAITWLLRHTDEGHVGHHTMTASICPAD
jgi:hypothetical protein